MLLPVFHLTVVIINSFTIWYDQNYVKFPFKEQISKHNLPFNNRILFLTMWGLTLQTVYFAVALLNDILGSNARSPKKTSFLRLFKDALFSLAFPLALYVFLAFWGIYFIDKDLIFPDELAKAMPAWCNHVMHTTIAPFILIELLFSPRNYPPRKLGVFLILLFNLSYISYLNYIYNKTDTWVYPVLDVMNWPLRVIFFAASAFVSVIMYILGENIDAVVNSPKKQVSGKKKR
ncbi:androgen-dependent TFPI-regulating protein-like [Pectinophora gossypiella]|uniref:Androgen-dependent TFPI-regulating protein n=1 Tax=Pectinophora gossypiella TaxID=13191 RepID=A0A1E1W437_PECGO|nr:androgen-dependent TFPI-regulating protein-like [Pectinophora gossypiella]